jgi:hypothetical protein
MFAFLSINVKRDSDWMFRINHPIAVNITNILSLDTDETVRNF